MREKGDWLPLVCAPTGDQTCNLGMYLDWEWNQQPFALWANAQPAESHQSGLSDVNIATQAFFWLLCISIMYVFYHLSIIFPLTYLCVYVLSRFLTACI